MPSGFEPSAPPVVGFDHTVYLITPHRLVAIDTAGATRWDQSEEGEVAGAGVTPEGNLIVAAGANLFAYDAAGKRTRLFNVPDDVLVTAPVIDEKGNLLVAGRRRLYCLP
jgi:outer membrane protein assembly factor BamB